MTIHHDKLAYGKLVSSREALSEERIAEMLKKLNEEEKKDGEQDNSDKDEKKDG